MSEKHPKNKPQPSASKKRSKKCPNGQSKRRKKKRPKIASSDLIDARRIEEQREAARLQMQQDHIDSAMRQQQTEELQTLLELFEGDRNPEAAKDKIRNEVYYWALVYDILALYLHTEYGFPPPMAYDEEKRQLMNNTPNFRVRFKVESDE